MIDAPAAGAASVAAQLLAFLREPARWRPRYIHGDERLPEGHVVLKFALKRFSPGWHRDLSAHDQEELVRAASAFVRQVCLWERATPYQLLCLPQDADAAAIKENYRLMMALMHPDRLETAGAWPANAAQRVNEAYSLLTDFARRREFDEGQAIKAHSEQVHVAQASVRVARGRASSQPRAMAGYLRRFLVVTGMLAVVFVVQAWWMNDVPSHYGLLERAYPTRAASWMRDALPPGSLPRFMESKPTIDFDPMELLAPTRVPQRLASVSIALPGPAANIAPQGEGTPMSTAPRSPPPAAFIAAGNEPAPIRLAQASTTPAAPASSPAPAPGPNTPTSQDVEVLVARLVSYYESGDVDGLMSLFDSDELGFWQGLRSRSAYSEFFRSSKQRRLRMDRLQWTVDAQSAAARGDATVMAEMADGSKLERKTDIVLDVRLRGGQARITRLAIFPDGR
jgi:type IV secretory pathway TrbD component